MYELTRRERREEMEVRQTLDLVSTLVSAAQRSGLSASEITKTLKRRDLL